MTQLRVPLHLASHRPSQKVLQKKKRPTISSQLGFTTRGRKRKRKEKEERRGKAESTMDI